MGGFLINGCGASDSYYKIKDVAHAFCPSCNAMRTFALMELRMKIRVLWIPTVPISKKYAVVCPVCKSGYYVDEQQKDDILYERVQVEVVKDGVILRKKNEPQRIPQPTPTPQPVPQPTPTPQPVPQPVPTPQPIPQPVPQPVPAPDPAPQPVPNPYPDRKDNGMSQGYESLLKRPSQKMCPACKLLYSEDKKFCDICGRRLVDREQG